MKLERDLRLFPALVAAGALLLVAALLPAGPARVVLFTCLSGLPPLLCVRRRWHWLELVVAPPAAALLLFACAGAGLGARSALVGFVPALLCLALALWARRVDRRISLVLGWPDAAAALALGLWLWPVTSVFRGNGLHRAGYLARSWFGRDSFYLFSIAEEAVQRNGWPVDNPFLAGVGNYYPSLLHVGLGTLAAQSTAPTPVGILWPVPLLLVASPVLCLLAALRGSGRSGWLAAVVVLVGLGGAVGLRPDLFVYPHTQALAMGWLFLLRWLWGESPAPAERLAALGLGCALVLAHSVTGATAVALLLGLSAAEALPSATRRAALLSLAFALLLTALLLAVNRLPYPGTRGAWSGAALGELGGFLAPWRLPLLGALGMLLAAWRKPLSALSPLGVVALGAVYYAYGSTLLDGGERWFVYFNAERFLHLGLLVALPVAASGVTLAGLAASLLVLGSAVFFPTPLARDTRSLRAAPALVLDGVDLAWFERIRRETPADARFFTNLGSYAMPAFTGRSQNPIEGNLWGNNTLPASEFNARLSDASSFFQQAPAAKLKLLERWGYSHVFLRRDGSRREVRSWTRQLGRGGFQLIAEDERYLLFAKATPGAAQ